MLRPVLSASFDFGYAARFDGETKACGLYIHDRDTGAMHVIPTPQKGGKPATLSVLEAVRKPCRALGIKTLVESVAPGSL